LLGVSAPSTLTRGRVRLAALVAAVVALAVALAVIFATSGEAPPAAGAASLVPDDALAYVHVSTSPGRPAVEQALKVAARLPDYPLFNGLVTRRLGALATGGGRVDFSRDVRPWLGDEAALALLGTQTSNVGSMVILDVRSRSEARTFITSAGAASGGAYHGAALYRTRSGTELAFVRHYLVMGQAAGVRSAIDASAGRRPALSASGAYRRSAAGEPADRVLDAYASPAGVRRLLMPQGGVIAALGALLYQPALTGVAVSLSATTGGAKVRVHSALDPNFQRAAGTPTADFAPTLDSVIPSGSMLLLDVTGLDRIAPHLLGALATGGVLRGLGPLLSRLGAALQSEGVNVKSVETLFGGETAVAIGPSTSSPGKGRASSPSLIIVTRTAKESATTAQLANLEPPLSQLFPAPASGSGQVPEFAERTVNGVTAHQLSLAPGLQLDYAVFRGLVVVSTSLNGIGAVAAQARALADQRSYSAALANRPQRVSSLVFLDFNQLLSLAEQTGLFRGNRYRLLRPDLQKVRAVGLTSTRGEADSTAELFLQIP
jgi:hypothetical protein